MKKAILTLMITVAMVTGLVACGESSENNTTVSSTEKSEEENASILVGTWAVKSVEVDGSEYSLAEIEAMGDDSVSNVYIIFKEGNSVCYYQDGDSDMTNYSFDSVNNIITINETDVTYDPSENTFVIEADNGSLIFEKISDSQDITQIPGVANKAETEIESETVEETTEESEESSDGESVSTEDGFTILNEYTYVDSIDSTHFIKVIRADKTGVFEEKVIVKDADGKVVGTMEDSLDLVSGTEGFFDITDFSLDENLDINDLNMEYSYECNDSSFLEPLNDCFDVKEYNASGDYLYITVEQTKDADIMFPQVRVLFFNGDTVVNSDYTYVEDLDGKGSESIVEMWEYGVTYDSVQIYPCGY